MSFFNKSAETLRHHLLLCLIALVLLLIGVVLYQYYPTILGDVFGFLGIVVFPFAFAWIAAIFTRPMVNWLHLKLHFPKTLAVLVTMLVCLAVFGGLITALVLVVIDVVGDLRIYFSDQNNSVSLLITQIQEIYNRLNMDFEQLQQWFVRIGEAASGLASQGFGYAVDFVKATPTALLLILVTVVAIFYWCRDEEKIKRVLAAPFPKRKRALFLDAYDTVSDVIGNYLRAQLLLVTVSITVCLVGLMILRVPNAIPMGLLAGGLDVIPMLGPGTVLVPWAIWCLLTGNFFRGIGLAIIFGAVILIRNLIEPKILGDRIGLHPLAALASLFVGMKLFGVVGLIIGPISVAVFMVVYRARKARPKQRPPAGPAEPPLVEPPQS